MVEEPIRFADFKQNTVEFLLKKVMPAQIPSPIDNGYILKLYKLSTIFLLCNWFKSVTRFSQYWERNATIIWQCIQKT